MGVRDLVVWEWLKRLGLGDCDYKVTRDEENDP